MSTQDTYNPSGKATVQFDGSSTGDFEQLVRQTLDASRYIDTHWNHEGDLVVTEV